jgi:hypothetical protein
VTLSAAGQQTIAWIESIQGNHSRGVFFSERDIDCTARYCAHNKRNVGSNQGGQECLLLWWQAELLPVVALSLGFTRQYNYGHV